MIRNTNRSVVSLFLSCLVFFTLIAAPPPSSVQAQSATLLISDYQFLTSEFGYTGAEMQAALHKANHPLQTYQKKIFDVTYTAGDFISIASSQINFAFNPRPLLVTLLVDDAYQPLYAPDLLDYLETFAVELWSDYIAYSAGDAALILQSGEPVSLSFENAASYAIARHLAASSRTESELRAKMDEWQTVFQTVFDTDPASTPLTAQDVAPLIPFMGPTLNQPSDTFIKINSFFDHDNPTYVSDGNILIFNGKWYSGANSSGCLLGVNCYAGHNGLDYSTGDNYPILAVADGVVDRYYYNPAPEPDDNSYIHINHGNGYRTVIYHMDPPYVQLGDTVTKGQVIGLSGNLGFSTGPHLHLALQRISDSRYLDPYGWWSEGNDPWNQGGNSWAWEGDLIADNREFQSQQFYRSFWNTDNAGYNGESQYTFSVKTSAASVNWGVWGTYIPAADSYDVYAYWPQNAANTNSAQYKVFHAAGSSLVTVNQASDGNRWVKLGTYNFNQGPAAVILTDLASDENKRVYFDAIRWESTTKHPPTDIRLSSTKLDENYPANTAFAILTTVDADYSNTFTYTLVSGAGSTDNASFSIDQDLLVPLASFDYETKSSYAIRLRSTDNEGLYIEKAFTITINNKNDPPSALGLSPASIAENQPAGTQIGILTTADQDAAESHTYTLVSGDGSTDNALVKISGNKLLTNAVLDYETKSTLAVRVRTTDKAGAYLEKAFTINVTNLNEFAPTNISLSSTAINENLAAGTLVGNLTASDADGQDAHTYALVSGTGSTDNAAFRVEGAKLLSNQVYNYEGKNQYSIRLRVTDSGGLTFEKAFTITINNRNDPPTALNLSSNTILENLPGGTQIGVFSAVDEDAGETFTYALVSGDGSQGNSSFSIQANTLRNAVPLNAETQETYSIRVRVTDSGGASFERVFSIQVLGVNEFAPHDIALTPPSVSEKRPVGTMVGNLTVADQDVQDSHTFALVSGTGSQDNTSFTLQGSTLFTNAFFDADLKNSYSIRVRVTDSGGLTFEKAIIITILNRPETYLPLH
ncbi:cadherin domain-containing protein [Ornatilinea apprima]|uniref:cadherin domain-containing protein n=1 Tax=Ornatilinea apprima TaxID=1134406 RepID=UPI000946647E|nr:cadherin domain-containing protein [Ornatilinea apprima]